MKEAALYIHIPFCKQKCLYCDFPSFSGRESYMEEYVDMLCRELDALPEICFSTIFIGGGTPTYLSLECIKKLKLSIDKLCKKEDVEFAVESNPGTCSKEKLKLLKDMGINRISMGLQAWQSPLLKALGRIHTAEDFVRAFEAARAQGFKNINVDIMFGLPGQTLQDMVETVRRVCGLSPEHVSCYSLIVEEGTPFCSMLQSGKLELPDENVEREMYSAAVDMLKEYGYSQYEVSNFAKEGKECRHNLVYWNLQEYIGCGSGAHSFFEGARYNNADNISDYIRNMKEKGNAIVETYTNTIEDTMEEFMFMGLRTSKGISEEEFFKRFNSKIDSVYGNVIEKYVNSGLIHRNKGKIFLSERGIEISNTIMSDFILDRK